MADIDYPVNLRGTLVARNSFSPQGRVERNDLRSGPPMYTLQDYDGFVMFRVGWLFKAIEAQVFQNFYRHTIASGSKLFNINLWIDGFDGEDQTKVHECYFDGVPNWQQRGKLWYVSANLLAIEEQTLSAEEGLSLVNVFNGIDYEVSEFVIDFNELIVLMEDEWPA